MKLFAIAAVFASLTFAADQSAPRLIVQYATHRAAGMDQFGPAFVPYVMVFASIDDATVDGFVFTVTYRTPSAPDTVVTNIQAGAVDPRYSAVAVVVMSGDIIPGSLKVTAKSFSARKDIPSAESH